MIAASAYPALMLNGDMTPMGMAPLSVIAWTDAVTGVLGRRLHVLAEYDRVIRSPSFEMRLPSVVSTRDYHKRRDPAFTRYNVFVRDRFRCQYCGERFAASGLTHDHVVPRSRGGESTWENVVAACCECNGRKDNRTPREAGMALVSKPYRPTWRDFDRIGRAGLRRDNLHRTWQDFLYWDSELERA
jgi:5-methylcytosine-specific restriction endonuclease McrA